MLSPGNSLFTAPFYLFHFISTMSEILLIFHVSKALFFHWTSHCDVTKCFEDHSLTILSEIMLLMICTLGIKPDNLN